MQLASEAARLLSSSQRLLLAISTTETGEDEQEAALLRGGATPHIVVGTPQRLVDLLTGPRTRRLLQGTRAVVLDEVDLLLPPPSTRTNDASDRRGRGTFVSRGQEARGRGYTRGGRSGRGRRGDGRGGVGSQTTAYYGAGGSIERRLARKRPAEVLLASVMRNRRKVEHQSP